MKILNKYELNMSLNPSINGWYKETLTVEPISWGEAIRKNCTSDLRKKGVIYKLTDIKEEPMHKAVTLMKLTLGKTRRYQRIEADSKIELFEKIHDFFAKDKFTCPMRKEFVDVTLSKEYREWVTGEKYDA